MNQLANIVIYSLPPFNDANQMRSISLVLKARCDLSSICFTCFTFLAQGFVGCQYSVGTTVTCALPKYLVSFVERHQCTLTYELTISRRASAWEPKPTSRRTQESSVPWI